MGSRLRGSATLLDGQTKWRFVAAAPWQPGHYAIATHLDLEDPLRARHPSVHNPGSVRSRWKSASLMTPLTTTGDEWFDGADSAQ